jgi:hypothetical protein
MLSKKPECSRQRENLVIAIISYEICVEFQRTTRRCIVEERNMCCAELPRCCVRVHNTLVMDLEHPVSVSNAGSSLLPTIVIEHPLR